MPTCLFIRQVGISLYLVLYFITNYLFGRGTAEVHAYRYIARLEIAETITDRYRAATLSHVTLI